MSNYLSKTYLIDKWNHTGFQRYFQNTGWMFFGKISSLIISFIATAYIARNLGPTNYGQLSYALSFISIFSFLAVLGIDQVLYRDLIKYPERKNIYLGSALILRIITSILTIILCISFALLLSPKDVSLYLIFILSLGFFFNSFHIINLEFQSNVQSKFPSLLSLYITIILNLLKITVVIFNKGVLYLAFVLLLESILYAIGFIYYRKKIYGSFRNLSFDKKIIYRLLHDSWPLIFSSAFALIYARMDQILIKYMIDTESVGLYDSAVRLSEVWYLIPNILVSSLFPAIVNAKKVSEQLYIKRLKLLTLSLIVCSLLIALPTTLFASEIIKVVFGTSFIGGATVLQIYIWSNIGTFLTNLSTSYLINENMKFVIFISTCTGMLSNILLNILLIPQYGIVGSAIATLISYTIIPISLLLFKKPRKMILLMLTNK